MKFILKLAIICLLPAAPALALQHPVPGKNSAQRICEVPYNANDVVQVQAGVSDAVAVVFGKDEVVTNVSISGNDLQVEGYKDGGNAVYLKSDAAVPPKPFTIRTLKAGVNRDYTMEWVSVRPPAPPPPAKIAMNGDMPTIEIPPQASSLTPCYKINFTYVAEQSAENTEKWKAGATVRWQAAKEVAARQAMDPMQCDTNHPFNPPGCNYAYMGMGDSELAPVGEATGRPAIWDFGGVTVLRFPGNMAIPIVLVVNRDGKEAQPSGMTVLDRGIVKIHSVESWIRLRDGDKVYCIKNVRYNQVGNPPATSTINDAIGHMVQTKAGR